MNDEPKLEAVICMGSSCFARGNQRNLAVLEDAAARRQWLDRVDLRGCRCMGRCNEGPNLSIDGRVYHEVDEGATIDLLTEHLASKCPETR